jgi:hypothetical protein
MTPLGTAYVDVALAAEGAESNQVMRSASKVMQFSFVQDSGARDLIAPLTTFAPRGSDLAQIQ